MWSICKKELRQFFSNLSGYIAIILFLLVNGLFLFILKDSNVFDYGYASLEKFFELSPWILMFLIPAITMRSFSEEFRVGTFEILQTKPLTKTKIVLGKYLAVILVLFFVIFPTLIYVITIQQLSATGDIDMGGIAGSYIGLFLLSSVFAAIGICCSSFTNNAVIAFLISAFVCLVLYFGFHAMSKLPIFVGSADYFIEMLGIDFHYQNVSRGMLDTREVVYFFSLIFLFLIITVKNIAKR